MKVSQLLYTGFINVLYFRKLPVSSTRKLRLFLASIKINVTYVILVKLFGMRLRRLRFLGLTVEGQDYGLLCYLFNEVFYRGEYAFVTRNPKPVIFDCGANVGMATIFFKWLYPDATIHAFEPNPEAFAFLQYNVQNNGLQSVHLHNVALVEQDGPVTFYTDPQEQASLKASLQAERVTGNSLTVDGKRLSGFIQTNIDFLKLDVEGAETIVFSDLEKNRSFAWIDSMVIEYHHHYMQHGPSLASFLSVLESNTFEYQLDGKCIPICSKDQFQDILIYAYRPHTDS